MTATHWTIKSAWSKAGVGTNIVLQLIDATTANAKTKTRQFSKEALSTKKKPARIAFDMGATPCFDDAIPAKYVFLSHGHVDHVGALFSHARAHAVSCGGEAPTYFVPAQLLPQIEQCQNAMSLIDSSTTTSSSDDENENKGRENLLKMTLVPVNPGDEFPLKGITYGSKTTFFMRAFEVDHAGHIALGYIVGSRKAGGLKPEYQHLDGKAIRELVQTGVSIQADPVEKIEVAYSGDTCRHGLIRRVSDDQFSKSAAYLDQAFRAELIICELTFLDSAEDEVQRQRSEEKGHLHINDLEDIFASHGRRLNNSHGETQTILFYHLSGRYCPAIRALDYIAAGLPSQIRNSCQIAIKSLLSDKEKASSHGIQQLIQPNGCVSVEDYLRWREMNKIIAEA